MGHDRGIHHPQIFNLVNFHGARVHHFHLICSHFTGVRWVQCGLPILGNPVQKILVCLDMVARRDFSTVEFIETGLADRLKEIQNS